jgi:hypothetical protein
MKIFVIISRENRFMWPMAYLSQDEADLICGYLDKKFELSGPYYSVELSVGLQKVKDALAKIGGEVQSRGDVQAVKAAAGEE